MAAVNKSSLSGGSGDFLQILAEAVARHGHVSRVQTTVVEFAGVSPVAGGPPMEFPGMAQNPGARWFSDLEARILTLLCKQPTLTRVEIATALGENPDNGIKFLLKNLVDRFMLDSGTNGYTLHVPAGKEADAYRAELCAWLDQTYPEARGE